MLEQKLSGTPCRTGPRRMADVGVRQFDGITEVSANVDGFRLRFRVPDACEVSRAGDPFLACALLPAMATGGQLVVEPGLPVSAGLLRNTSTLQEIFHAWNPRLRIIPASATSPPAQVLNAGGMSLFCGGVDSTYTLLKNVATIDRAVYMRGFDFGPEDTGLVAAVQRNAEVVRTFGMELLPVETNHYAFGNRYGVSRNHTQGSILGALALLLRFQTAYVPASVTYDQAMRLGQCRSALAPVTVSCAPRIPRSSRTSRRRTAPRRFRVPRPSQVGRRLPSVRTLRWMQPTAGRRHVT